MRLFGSWFLHSDLQWSYARLINEAQCHHYTQVKWQLIKLLYLDSELYYNVIFLLNFTSFSFSNKSSTTPATPEARHRPAEPHCVWNVFLMLSNPKTAKKRHKVIHAILVLSTRSHLWSEGFLSSFSSCRVSDRTLLHCGQLKVSKKCTQSFFHLPGLTFEMEDYISKNL